MNDQPDWSQWRQDPEFEAVYPNASRWYAHYRRLITLLFTVRRFPMIRARSILGTIGLLPRRCNLPTITAERLLLLEQSVKTIGQPIDLLLVDALALAGHGLRDRYTSEVDGELTGPLHPLVALTAEGVPADLMQDISEGVHRWRR